MHNVSCDPVSIYNSIFRCFAIKILFYCFLCLTLVFFLFCFSQSNNNIRRYKIKWFCALGTRRFHFLFLPALNTQFHTSIQFRFKSNAQPHFQYKKGFFFILNKQAIPKNQLTTPIDHKKTKHDVGEHGQHLHTEKRLQTCTRTQTKSFLKKRVYLLFRNNKRENKN